MKLIYGVGEKQRKKLGSFMISSLLTTEEFRLKPKPRHLNLFFEFIRAQPCHFMDILVDLPNYPRQCSVHWDMNKGKWCNEVSHIMRKGSTRREEHEGNVFPNCRIHHHFFEMLSPEIRKEYLRYGQLYVELYREKVR